MRVFARRKSEQNRAILDPWSIVHFGTGLAFGLMETPKGLALPVAIAYEFGEHFLEETEVGKDVFETSGPEVVPNSIVDVLIFALGHELGRRWNRS